MRSADVALPRRVDVTTSSDVRYALHIAIDSAVDPDVLVDASAVETVDVAGLGVLVAAHRRAKQAGLRLVLCDVQPRIVRLLAVTRLHRVLVLDRTAARTG
ncbi:MAG TPA: STAS domain-containing protein [Actinomycetes bacterium]|nr:STAS domain-containing protein [Actinomycetes bacterium]